MSHKAGFEHVTVDWLVEQLRQLHHETDWELIHEHAYSEEDDCLDVRLQVWSGGCALRVGSSNYDLHHHGYWGASSISRDDTTAELRAIAEDLISQAQDMAADDRD